jgi:tetratricopeptide (TPR) repeat protein
VKLIHELYLRGRFFLNKYTKEGFLQAFDYFQKAIEKEPNFSLAYVGLAETYVCSEDIGMKRPKEAYPLAKEAVKKALDIDDRLAEAHTGLAQIKFWYEWDWSGSEHELKRAIDLNPSYSAAYIIYSQLLRVQRKEAEQLEKIRRAWELDPLGLYVNIVLGTALFNTGAYDQAIEQFSKTLDLDPDFAVAYWGLGVSYEAKGSIEEAITAFQKAIDLSPGDVHNYADLAHAFALAGKKGEALKILNELIQRSQKTYVPAFVIARIYEGLGDKDAAFEWLEKAYEERSSWIPFVEAMHYFDSIRGDERYSTLLKKIGLP